jgi:ABC-type lipoprotein export system ATPase subunit
LEINQVSKTYRRGSDGEVRALDRVSLSLEAGQFTAVKGPSGCGKTTLLLIAGGLLEPSQGAVRVAQQEPYAMPSEPRARFRAETVGFVFQQFHLVPYLSVLENVLASALASGNREAGPRARELIAHFGLEPRQHHVPGELSTGERQRTALARALLNRPKLLLADEPTGNLDRDNAEAVMSYLTEFARSGGAVLLVSHDDFAVQHASHVIQLRDGKPVSPA